MPILDPSTFHGYTDSLQRYIDGVRSCGEEKVKEEECDVIEVSIMRGQRTWKLWLSKRDHPIAREFLEENGATFPNVLDDSQATKQTVYSDYQTLSMSAVPLSYLIDREGKIVSRWYGVHRGSRLRELLRGLGVGGE